jgi:hypothetical protein
LSLSQQQEGEPNVSLNFLEQKKIHKSLQNKVIKSMSRDDSIKRGTNSEEIKKELINFLSVKSSYS